MSVFNELTAFYEEWRGEKGIIGFSENGVPIKYVAVKKTGFPVIIAQYAIHAREYVTSYLAMMQAKHFEIYGRIGSVYFIPVVNPDGVAEALNGNNLYKANARRVDLNVNFDAKWGTGEKNVRFKSDENFIGDYPFSESETKSLRDFTLLVKPDITLSYHSKGEEIYWEFFQDEKARERDKKIARKVSLVTGYPLKSAGASAGGYKDWCIEKLNITALTIEVGSDALSHPIGKEYAQEIFLKNRGVFKVLTEENG